MALSPMMKQYKAVKDDYKDCILMYRLGDFYEMFFDDALTASKALGLTLTGRDCGLEERAPMCGVPYHALNTYLSELVEQGFKVAICEQLTEPNKVDIVKRGVVRVVTSGTKIDPDMIDEKENNFIACISDVGGVYSIAWADISTGEVNVITCKNKGDITELTEQLLKISPSEIIANSEIAKLEIKEITRNVLPKITKYHDWAFLNENAVKRIKRQFNVLTLEPYGIDKNKSAIAACGALFEYLEDTQKRQLDNFEKINYVESENYMKLDSNTRRNLELLYSNRDGKRFGTLFGLLNKTKTPMGARLLGKWIEEPLIDETRINNRLFAVKNLIDDFYNKDVIIESLSKIRDIERLTSKIAYKNANPADFLSLKNSLETIPQIKKTLEKFDSPKLKALNDNINDFKELYDYLNSAISDDATTQTKDGGYIKVGFNAELDKLRTMMTSSKTLINQMEENERAKTGIKGLKIGYNRVFG
ncbi:MAG: DNA mismatch repair protein MutS, partial [Clostridia bacterium]